ncbi:DUF3558 domain-containing protein [Nocardia donostiensis]|uniref:DUF3558 domain-containing protein n=1 Tax=Nocardia donostiensis TaxID=1538463 RepID=UPI0020CA73FF|nr:DUF3558 domain-containing protein [Nocardia donostiensis]
MVRAVLGGVAVVGVAAGCSVYVDGEPAAEGQSATTTEEDVAFNPCTDLSDEALRATRVDPASKSTVTDAPTGPVTWRICKWRSAESSYFVTVSSSVHTQDEARANDKLTGFRDVEIGDRAGLVYYDKADEDKLRCYVNLSATQGMYEVTVGWAYSKKDSIPESPPCSLAIEHAKDLEPYLPE